MGLVWRSKQGTGETVVLAPMFRYRLLDPDGNDLGPLATRRNDWRPGERLSRWHGEKLEIISVVPSDEGDNLAGYIVVTPTG